MIWMLEAGAGTNAESVLRYAAKADASDSSVAQQIKDNAELIASQPVVASVDKRTRSGMAVSAQKRYAKAELSKYGNVIDRKGFGTVEFGDNEIDSSFAYINGDAEYSALFAVPLVMKRGIELDGGHADHKGRGYSTVTFAARVEIGDNEGFMAVVVKKMNKNRYKMLRILSPDCSVMRLNAKTEPTTGGGSNVDKAPSPIDSVFNVSISNETENSNSEMQNDSEKPRSTPI